MRKFVALALGAGLMISCGGGGGGGTNYGTNPPPSNNNPPPANNPPVAGTSVSITDNAFDPGNLSAAVGATITWSWDGGYGVAHNVTFDGTTVTSGNKTTGTYQRTFNAAGSYKYHCTNHAGMNGTVTIQ